MDSYLSCPCCLRTLAGPFKTQSLFSLACTTKPHASSPRERFRPLARHNWPLSCCANGGIGVSRRRNRFPLRFISDTNPGYTATRGLAGRVWNSPQYRGTLYHYCEASEGQKLHLMQLDADRYPLLYSLRGALSRQFRGKVGSDGFEKVLIGTRGARETLLRGRKGRAAKNSVLTSGEKQLKC